jgi:hypothetical protein
MIFATWRGATPGPRDQGAMTMAIWKKIKDRGRPDPNAEIELTMPSVSYPATDALAQVVIDAWENKPFPNPGDEGLRKQLMDRDPKGYPSAKALKAAKDRLHAAGFEFERPVVISESEHDNDYVMVDPKEIVFVLPDKDRITVHPGHSLLETAKMLMACTPNGI